MQINQLFTITKSFRSLQRSMQISILLSFKKSIYMYFSWFLLCYITWQILYIFIVSQSIILLNTQKSFIKERITVVSSLIFTTKLNQLKN